MKKVTVGVVLTDDKKAHCILVNGKRVVRLFRCDCNSCSHSDTKFLLISEVWFGHTASSFLNPCLDFRVKASASSYWLWLKIFNCF